LSRTRGMVAHKQALILGTGGAAKAAAWALREMDIPYAFVSRKRKKGGITYADLDEPCMSSHTLIIQATPLGMAPARDTCPDLPWDWIGPRHLLMDLVYNPRTTLFMKKGKARGARVMNGLKMLYLQAEFAWNFWHPFADQ
jgi:shikimate dehydrogenase